MTHHERRSVATLFYLAVTGIAAGFLVGLSLSPVISGVLTSVLALVLSAVGAMAGVKEQETSSDVTEGDQRKVRFILPSLDVRPIAVLTLALTCGSCAGLLARSNDLFGPIPSVYLYRWRGAGLPEAELKLRILNNVGGLGIPSAESFQDLQRYPIAPHKEDTVPAPKPIPAKVEHAKSESRHPAQEIADAAGAGRHSGTGLYGALALPPAGACADTRNHTDIGQQQQRLERIAATVQRRLVAPVAACRSDECVALALEVLCPSEK